MGSVLARVTWRLQRTERTETKRPREANLGTAAVSVEEGGAGLHAGFWLSHPQALCAERVPMYA